MSEEAVAVVGRVVVASGLAAAAAVPPSLLYNSALSLPCLLLLYSTLSCLVASLLYNPALSLAPLLYPALFLLYSTTLTCPCCLASFTHLSTLRALFHVLPYPPLSACPCLAPALHSTLADLHPPPQGDNIFLSSTSPFSWPTYSLSLCRMYPHLFTLDCEIKASISLAKSRPHKSFTNIICSVLALFVCSC